MPLLPETCARECALYALLAPDAPAQVERVLTGYFGQRVAKQVLTATTATPSDVPWGASTVR